MRFFYSFLLCLLFSVSSVAQVNLVPNPSFEDYDTCPNDFDQIDRVKEWSNYGVNNSTPDYFNNCDTGLVNPNKVFFQSAHTGAAIVGVVTYANSIIPNYREYIGVQLSQPLVIGTKYFLSFWTTLGESFNQSCPTNNIGMLLSTVPHSTTNPLVINNFSHLNSTSVISDTLSWILVSGSIIADSAYNYLALGNFYSDSITSIINWGSTHEVGYYGVDNICVSTDSLFCASVVGVKENGKSEIKVFPNPVTSLLNIYTGSASLIEIKVFNTFGVLIMNKFLFNQLTLDFSSLNSGCYLLSFFDKNGKKIRNDKIFKL